MAKNLADIAKYGVKGGNEELRFKAGLGRDLGSDVEAQIWREGGSGRSARGGEIVLDERGFTIEEIPQLDSMYLWLMNRRRDTGGYLLGTTGR